MPPASDAFASDMVVPCQSDGGPMPLHLPQQDLSTPRESHGSPMAVPWFLFGLMCNHILFVLCSYNTLQCIMMYNGGLLVYYSVLGVI
jgi:hypothetical protein